MKARNDQELCEFWTEGSHHGERFAACVTGVIDSERQIGYYRHHGRENRTPVYYAVDLTTGIAITNLYWGGPQKKGWEKLKILADEKWEEIKEFQSGPYYNLLQSLFQRKVQHAEYLEQAMFAEIEKGRKTNG